MRYGTKDTMDRTRKKVIAAVFGWYKNQGRVVTMEYVIGTICQAGNVKRINELSLNALNRIYAEFCQKQRIQYVKRNESVYSNISMN